MKSLKNKQKIIGYTWNKADRPLMKRIDQLKQDYKRILKKWKEALDQTKTEYSRDAAILRFELAYEVGWKLIQLLAREEGYDVHSPRQAFQQAYSMGWISDEVVWYDIIEARNKATHVYREEYAENLYAELSTYYKAFKELEISIID